MSKRKAVTTPSSDLSVSLTPSGAERRQQLILAAYQLIAEKGFEGLRTREIAERVSVNHATLHYHFPTKEDLISGVVDYLIRQFTVSHALELPATMTPLALIRSEFMEIAHQVQDMPEMFVVYSELYLRSLRDPSIADLFGQINREWRRFLSETLQRGVDDRSFRPDLDVSVSTTIVVAMIKGIRDEAIGKSREEIEHISALVLAQLEHWLIG